MALDNTAADASLDAWIATITPTPTDEQKQAIRDGMRELFRAIFAGIKANAVVSPAGTPTSLRTTTGVLLTGTGVLT